MKVVDPACSDVCYAMTATAIALAISMNDAASSAAIRWTTTSREEIGIEKCLTTCLTHCLTQSVNLLRIVSSNDYSATAFSTHIEDGGATATMRWQDCDF